VPRWSLIPSRYQYLGEAKVGGQSTVRFYRDKRLERDVAIKLINDIRDMKRMRGEVRALSSIRSKHVIEVYDLLDTPSSLDFALLTERLSGHDLSSWRARYASNGDLVAPLLKIAFQISAGLSDVHAAGVTHGDVNPTNMREDSNGIVKLFDFGLARFVGAVTTNTFIGTRGFAAPECYTTHEAISQASDSYAYAATILWLAEGSLPAELLSVPSSIPSSSLTRLRSWGVPEDFVQLLERCFSASGGARPPLVEIRSALHNELIRGRHRGRLCSSSNSYELSTSHNGIQIKAGTLGDAIITYDSLHFNVNPMSGSVAVNSQLITAPMRLPASSVLAFGDPSEGAARRYYTFDVSHPEVVL